MEAESPEKNKMQDLNKAAETNEEFKKSQEFEQRGHLRSRPPEPLSDLLTAFHTGATCRCGVNGECDKFKETLKANDEGVASLEQSLRSQKQEMQAMLAALEKKVLDQLKEKEERHQKWLLEREDNFRKQLYECKEFFSKEFFSREESFRTTLSQRDEFFSKELVKRQENFSKELSKERTEKEESLKRQVVKLISKEFSDRDESFKKELLESQDTFRKEFSEREESLKKEVLEMVKKELSQREEHFKKELSLRKESFSKQLSQMEKHFKKELFEKNKNFKKELSEREKALKKEFSEQVGRVRTLISEQENKQKKLEITIMERERLSKLEGVDNQREIQHLSDMVFELTVSPLPPCPGRFCVSLKRLSSSAGEHGHEEEEEELVHENVRHAHVLNQQEQTLDDALYMKPGYYNPQTCRRVDETSFSWTVPAAPQRLLQGAAVMRAGGVDGRAITPSGWRPAPLTPVTDEVLKLQRLQTPQSSDCFVKEASTVQECYR